MPKELSKKDLDLIEIAKRGGNDATLFLLTKLQELEGKVNILEGMKLYEFPAIPKELGVEIKGAELVTIKGEKGDSIKGDKGDRGESGRDGIDGRNGIDGKDGKDGLTPIKGIDYFDGKDGIDGKNGESVKPEQLQELTNSLKEELMPLIDSKIGKTRPIFGGGGGKTRFVKVNLSSQLNGVTKTFSIGFTHYGIDSVNSSSAPFGAFIEGTDYNEVGNTIVFTDSVDASVSLAQGQSLIVKVLK